MSVTAFSTAITSKARARWQIRGLSWMPRSATTPVRSPDLVEVLGNKFYLELYLAGELESPGYVQLFLGCTGTADMRLRFEVTVVNQFGGDDRTAGNVSEYLVFDANTQGIKQEDERPLHNLYGWNKFVPWADLTRRDGYVKDDTLILELVVTAVAQGAVVHQSAAESALASGNHKNLATDIAELLRTKRYSDLVLRTGGGEPPETLQAHRLVLAARSPVFAQMFYSAGLREASAHEVDLPDMDPTVAQAFLQALYTDELEASAWDDDELLCHLLAAFHKYQVAPWLERCQRRVAARLNDETAAERLMMADLLDLPSLRACVVEYITSSQQRLSQVQATESFARLGQRRPHLLAELLASVAPPAKRARGPELPANLDGLTNQELKRFLADRGLQTSGKKTQLLARLRDCVGNPSVVGSQGML